jgi:hypothetical protein
MYPHVTQFATRELEARLVTLRAADEVARQARARRAARRQLLRARVIAATRSADG